MTVDRSQWWVALDGADEPTLWTSRNGHVWAMQRLWNTHKQVWAYLTEGLPDRGDCTDCTAVPCPAHDLAGVTIPKDQP